MNDKTSYKFENNDSVLWLTLENKPPKKAESFFRKNIEAFYFLGAAVILILCCIIANF